MTIGVSTVPVVGPLSNAQALVVDRVAVRRGGRLVIRDCSATLAAGEALALVGPNGVGKSTLLAAIGGMLAPHAGQISVQTAERTLDVWGKAAARAVARSYIGVAPDIETLPSYVTARELIALASVCRATVGRVWHARQSQHAATSTVAASAAAADWADGVAPAVAQALALGEILDVPLGRASLGQRRRAALAAAWASQPAILILDEPDNGLDANRLDKVAALLRVHCQRGGMVVLASHDAAFIEAIGARSLHLQE